MTCSGKVQVEVHDPVLTDPFSSAEIKKDGKICLGLDPPSGSQVSVVVLRSALPGWPSHDWGQGGGFLGTLHT